MALLKETRLGIDVPLAVAAQIANTFPAFPRKQFLSRVFDGYDDLELVARGNRIAEMLRDLLPDDLDVAAEILLASLPDDPSDVQELSGSDFGLLPCTLFVGRYGLEEVGRSLDALNTLTKLFTGEWGIRPYLQNDSDPVVAELRMWADDPSWQVRRLVSEGTRPRLHWAEQAIEGISG